MYVVLYIYIYFFFIHTYIYIEKYTFADAFTAHGRCYGVAQKIKNKKQKQSAQQLNHCQTVQKARLAENLLGSFVFPRLRGSAGTCAVEFSTLSELELLNRARDDICHIRPRGLPFDILKASFF